MSDIVERLRAYAKDQGGRHNIDETCETAADEIEQLRAQVAALREALREAIDFADQDFQVLTPTGEAMVARWRAALTAPAPGGFQARVHKWLLTCFGEAISRDKLERNHRFLEEALELVQACGCTADEAHQLVDYTFGRAVGERVQEVGGVMVTLAALCAAQELNMEPCGEQELTRINAPGVIEKIRAKQAAKPKHGPLPAARAALEGK